MATLEGTKLTVWIAVLGPSGAGKRTTLDKLRARIPGATPLVEETTGESQQLVYFEFPYGPWQQFDVRIRLLALTGQVFYDSDREKLIRGSSGALFVASRDPADRERNEEARDNLDRHVGNRAGAGYPVLLQLNKSDLLNAALPSSLQLGTHIGDKQITVARTGTGIPELTNAVTDELVPAALMSIVVEGIMEPVSTVASDFLAAIGATDAPKKPVAKKPAANNAAAKKPAAKKPAAKKPATKKPAPKPKKPVAKKKPVATAKKKPSAKKKPAAKKHTAKTPAAKKKR